MDGMREQWHTLVSILICAAVIVLGILLYPLVFLFFTVIALIHPLYRRVRPAAAPSRREVPQGKGGK